VGEGLGVLVDVGVPVAVGDGVGVFVAPGVGVPVGVAVSVGSGVSGVPGGKNTGGFVGVRETEAGFGEVAVGAKSPCPGEFCGVVVGVRVTEEPDFGVGVCVGDASGVLLGVAPGLLPFAGAAPGTGVPPGSGVDPSVRAVPEACAVAPGLFAVGGGSVVISKSLSTVCGARLAAAEATNCTVARAASAGLTPVTTLVVPPTAVTTRAPAAILCTKLGRCPELEPRLAPNVSQPANQLRFSPAISASKRSDMR
jgi:hypothetical protein